jgi:hypothetical protein
MWTVNEQGKVDKLRDDTDRLRTNVEDLTREVARLSAIAEALWRLLQEQHGFDETKLSAMVAAVEASHKADPHSGPTPAVLCKRCGRPQAKRHARCMYCGAERAVDVFE